eukprot:1186225-Prorocentrum_minimum.AAC.1
MDGQGNFTAVPDLKDPVDVKLVRIHEVLRRYNLNSRPEYQVRKSATPLCSEWFSPNTEYPCVSNVEAQRSPHDEKISISALRNIKVLPNSRKSNACPSAGAAAAVGKTVDLQDTGDSFYNIASFYGSSCANNGKDALNTPGDYFYIPLYCSSLVYAGAAAGAEPAGDDVRPGGERRLGHRELKLPSGRGAPPAPPRKVRGVHVDHANHPGLHLHQPPPGAARQPGAIGSGTRYMPSPLTSLAADGASSPDHTKGSHTYVGPTCLSRLVEGEFTRGEGEFNSSSSPCEVAPPLENSALPPIGAGPRP